MKYKLYLGTGTNLGNKLENLDNCNTLITENIGAIKKESSIYKSEAWGFESLESFYNQVIEVETRLSPAVILDKIKNIEKELGRTSKSKNEVYADRLIDVDILFFENLICWTPELEIPHKYITDRKFAIEPMAEIAPDFIHPVIGKDAKSLLLECKDKSTLTKVN